ncbi:MAG: class I SAM-dependent methyltransferase, partial [Eubacterium sp.]|nr:class I SAM-dependent methyltransferase [Eubacterium sp.]
VSPSASIAELGCGTGTMTGLLVEEGLDVMGLDISSDMLAEARKKYPDISFLEADMRDFKLPEKKDVIVSICDSINYVLTTEDLVKTFSSVRENLNEGGIFIFDLKTKFFFENALDGRTYRDRGSGFRCTWKNHFDVSSNIHSYLLDIKVKDGGKWVSTQEIHRQRAFAAREIIEAAKLSGFEKGGAYDAFTFDKPKKRSDRIYIVLR